MEYIPHSYFDGVKDGWYWSKKNRVCIDTRKAIQFDTEHSAISFIENLMSNEIWASKHRYEPEVWKEWLTKYVSHNY